MDRQQDNSEELVKRFFDQLESKAEREYPKGRIGADDEGSLAVMVAADYEHHRVRVHFGKPIAWYAVTPAEARTFAAKLIEMADKLEKPSDA